MEATLHTLFSTDMTSYPEWCWTQFSLNSVSKTHFQARVSPRNEGIRIEGQNELSHSGMKFPHHQ